MDAQAKGALPVGFFDNKEADMFSRGIISVKPAIKDEYREFEKLIQEDLQKVDRRMEEEEYDAAEKIEEAEIVDQRNYRERIELLRKKRSALKAARTLTIARVSSKKTTANEKPSSHDDDSDEDFKVDWRAKNIS